ncbi:MAG TPA: hypothetical protein VJ792_05720 [Candidatus Nitrosotalea sp.]|nr:hypothetical protein [Candidatus Nitrosotalea sp.]
MLKQDSRTGLKLVILLAIVFVVWVVPDLSGQDIAMISSDLTYIALTVFLTVTAFYQVAQAHNSGRGILIWVIFSVFAMFYTAAQHIWAVNELIFGTRPFPSLADVAFLADSLCLIAFFMLYIQSLGKKITKKMLLIAVLPSIVVVGVSAYSYVLSNSTDPIFIQVLLFSYPFLDAIALVPAMLGIMIWSKERPNLSLLAICSSMMPLATGDTLFQLTSQNNTYFTGSLPDFFFYVQIVLLTFGVYLMSNSMKSNVREEPI